SMLRYPAIHAARDARSPNRPPPPPPPPPRPRRRAPPRGPSSPTGPPSPPPRPPPPPARGAGRPGGCGAPRRSRRPGRGAPAGSRWLRREQDLESREAGPGGGGGHGEAERLGRGVEGFEDARVHRQIIDVRLHAQRVEVPVGEGRKTAALARTAIGQDERDASEPLRTLWGRAAHPPLYHAGADQRASQPAEPHGPRAQATRAERRHQQRRVDRKRVDRHEDRLAGPQVPDSEPAAPS